MTTINPPIFLPLTPTLQPQAPCLLTTQFTGLRPTLASVPSITVKHVDFPDPNLPRTFGLSSPHRSPRSSCQTSYQLPATSFHSSTSDQNSPVIRQHTQPRKQRSRSLGEI